MKELANIEEKLVAGVDHFTTSEVMFLMDEIVFLGGIIKRLKNQEKVSEKEIGQIIKSKKHLTLIQGGLK